MSFSYSTMRLAFAPSGAIYDRQTQLPGVEFFNVTGLGGGPAFTVLTTVDLSDTQIVVTFRHSAGGNATLANASLSITDQFNTVPPITAATIGSSVGFASAPTVSVTNGGEVVGLNLSGVGFADNATLTLNITYGGIQGGIGADTLILGATDDFVSTFSGDDAVFAGAGRDVVRGGTGKDTLVGEAGNDVLYGDEDADLLFGAAFVNGAPQPGSGDDFLDGAAGNDGLWGFDGDDTLIGGAGQDVLSGGLGNDRLDGREDSDILIGIGYDGNGRPVEESGVDNITGGDGNDGIWGFGGADLLHGEAGDDYVEGGADNDTITGAEGNDYLIGGTGNDLIHGGVGFDFMFGQEGADTFIFRRNDSWDTVFDFSTAQGDKLRMGNGFGWSTAAQVIAAMVDTSSGGVASTTLSSMDGMDRLVLFGVRPAEFTASFIEFV